MFEMNSKLSANPSLAQCRSSQQRFVLVELLSCAYMLDLSNKPDTFLSLLFWERMHFFHTWYSLPTNAYGGFCNVNVMTEKQHWSNISCEFKTSGTYGYIVAYRESPRAEFVTHSVPGL